MPKPNWLPHTGPDRAAVHTNKSKDPNRPKLTHISVFVHIRLRSAQRVYYPLFKAALITISSSVTELSSLWVDNYLLLIESPSSPHDQHHDQPQQLPSCAPPPPPNETPFLSTQRTSYPNTPPMLTAQSLFHEKNPRRTCPSTNSRQSTPSSSASGV